MTSPTRAHILIVEDSPTQAEKLRLILTSNGMQASAVGSAEEALLELGRVRPDALLVDLHLPGRSGAQLCTELKEDPANQDLPVVLLTGHNDPVSMLRGLEAGADYFMTKDRDPDQIVDRIQRILEQGAWPREELDDSSEPIESDFEGEFFEFTTGRRQFVEVLFSTFEDLRQLSDELRRRKDEAEATLSSVLDAVPVGIIVTGTDGQTKRLNQAARTMLGSGRKLSVDQWPAAYGLESRGGPIAAEELPTRLTARDGEPRREVEMCITAAADQDSDTVRRPVLVNTRAVYDEDGQLNRVITTLTSISERKRAEQLRQQLIHADRLAAIGQLSTAVAHELNNPAAFVIGNLSVMKRHHVKKLQSLHGSLRECIDQEPDPKRRHKLEECLAAHEMEELVNDTADIVMENLEGMERIKSIVNELRTFGRRGDDQPSTAKLDKVIDSARMMVEHKIQDRARLVEDLEPVPPVCGDQSKLAQVVMNLLTNAADAIEPGDADANKIVIQTQVEDGCGVLRVIDSGRGIPDEIKDKIFEPFFTTKPSGVGTGLGLAICQEIVELAGGTFTLTSRADEGTTGEIVLPLVDDDSPQ